MILYYFIYYCIDILLIISYIELLQFCEHIPSFLAWGVWRMGTSISIEFAWYPFEATSASLMAMALSE